MTDPNESNDEQRIWTPDPDARDVPAGDPFGEYFKDTDPSLGPDI